MSVLRFLYLTGGLISGTAGPLLPDNIAFQSIHKIWRSPSVESFPSLTLQQQSIGTQETSNVFRRYSLRGFHGFKLPSPLHSTNGPKESMAHFEEKMDDLKISDVEVTG